MIEETTLPAPIAAMQAELAIVGGLLMDNGLFEIVSDRVRPEHFASDLARTVYTEIARQLNGGTVVDVVTVYEALAGAVSLPELSALAQFLPSARTMANYSDMVLDRHQSRQLLNAANAINDLAHETQRPIAQRVDEAQGLLTKLDSESGEDEWSEIFEGLVQHSEILDARAEGGYQGWSTGLTDLDRALSGGLRAGGLYILAARPSMGKTALAMGVALHMAEKRAVGFLSMEMPLSELRDRQTAILGRIPLESILLGKELDFAAVTDAVDRSRMLKFYAQDKPGLTLAMVRNRARKLKRLKGLEVLVIDYIGLMEGSDKQANRTQQLGEISRGLKSLAKELDIAILCLAQLNRDVERRGGKSRPMLSDLRDSGEIEQDADVVMFVHREEHANPNAGPQYRGYAEIIIGKNRQGRTGLVHATYLGEMTLFQGWVGDPPTATSAPSNQSHSRGMQ